MIYSRYFRPQGEFQERSGEINQAIQEIIRLNNINLMIGNNTNIQNSNSMNNLDELRNGNVNSPDPSSNYNNRNSPNNHLEIEQNLLQSEQINSGNLSNEGLNLIQNVTEDNFSLVNDNDVTYYHQMDDYQNENDRNIINYEIN